MYNMHSRKKNYASHAEILMVLHTCIKKIKCDWQCLYCIYCIIFNCVIQDLTNIKKTTLGLCGFKSKYINI